MKNTLLIQYGLDSLIYIFSILGGIVSVKTVYEWVAPYRKVSWKKVEKGVFSLKEKLIHDNYYPTLIVGIGRGGAVVGALLSGCLGQVPLLVIDRAYDWSDKCRRDSLSEEIKLNKNLEKVLLVAGELHTGGTAKLYKEYFENIGANEIRFISFMTGESPAYVANHHVIKTSNARIRLPWMMTKDYPRPSLGSKE